MAFSMFDACVPVCAQMLTGLAGVIDKAAAQAAAKKFDEAVLLADRLYPDMFTLARQIRQATDFARNAPGRLAGVTLPDFPTTDDTSFAEAKTRIEKSLAFVKDFAPAQIEGTRSQRHLLDGRTARDVLQGPSLSAAFLPAESVLPHHHRVQHPAPSRDRDRQARLPGYVLSERLSRLADPVRRAPPGGERLHSIAVARTA